MVCYVIGVDIMNRPLLVSPCGHVILRSLSKNDDDVEDATFEKSDLYFSCTNSGRPVSFSFHNFSNRRFFQLNPFTVHYEFFLAILFIVHSRLPENLKNGHFTFLFCRGRQRNLPDCIFLVKFQCFVHQRYCLVPLQLTLLSCFA